MVCRLAGGEKCSIPPRRPYAAHCVKTSHQTHRLLVTRSASQSAPQASERASESACLPACRSVDRSVGRSIRPSVGRSARLTTPTNKPFIRFKILDNIAGLQDPRSRLKLPISDSHSAWPDFRSFGRSVSQSAGQLCLETTPCSPRYFRCAATAVAATMVVQWFLLVVSSRR